MNSHLSKLSGMAGDVLGVGSPERGAALTDTDRLNWILERVAQFGTNGLASFRWTNPADADPLEEDDVILDRAAIDRAMLKERRAA